MRFEVFTLMVVVFWVTTPCKVRGTIAKVNFIAFVLD
jgi:hypothetical protein